MAQGIYWARGRISGRADVAAASIGASNTQIIANGDGDFLDIYTTLNQDVILTITNRSGETHEYEVAASRGGVMLPFTHKGAISVKHNGVAASSGKLIVQSVNAGEF